MDYDEKMSNTFLEELYRRTEGDTERQAGMQEIGEALGLEKSQVGSLAEELIVEGLVDLKTLAGGIGITAEAIDRLQGLGLVGGGGGEKRSLSGESVLTGEDRGLVEEILAELRPVLAGAAKDWAACEEAVIDVKTIEVQLLSARPKAAVVLALFESLRQSLTKSGREEAAPLLAGLLQEKR